MPQGLGSLGKPVREQQLLLHPRPLLVLSRLLCRCLHQPDSPGNCLKPALGARLGWQELLGSLMLQLAPRPLQQLKEGTQSLACPSSHQLARAERPLVTNRQGEHVLLQPILSQAQPAA